ncbi:hypothetical protein N9X43_02125 [Gammaproteobacteria bacterium]|jgi:hypothetical protein|nr:hypothetical protein [Gammaproteobacteria bacterium]MDA9574774.1 hypothetical protein [Gammaproteobacteria bacterium]MDA9867313.1 hypothetical protein [Gammaproteobacteria bacterium]MDB2503416.1 hypothetical protein [Gammaproteobacteria bacterium]MDC0546650.1 hypothetical protein [Gammaproteobacteria bacterium]
MSFEEIRYIAIVYASSIIPILILIKYRHELPKWVPAIYLGSFIVCALGWEIWFTYGLIDGESVIERRSNILNQWIPLHINWIVNSLADAGTVCLGGLWLIWVMGNKKNYIFNNWRWSSFFILTIWCIGQNIFVELFLYYDQLSENKNLSWAPLIPTGNIFNPVLFEINGRSLMFQTQLPWIILPPLLYLAVIRLTKKFD